MSLVNLDGTAIFGAGSEWFWSMAQFVLVAGSLVAIYLQVRAQRADRLIAQSAEWLRAWNDDAFLIERLTALIDLDGRPVEAGLPWSVAEVGNFFDRLGYLTSERHLRTRDVWEFLRGPIGSWWGLFELYIEQTRSLGSNTHLFDGFERLEQEMRRLDVQAFGSVLEIGMTQAQIPSMIEDIRATLQVRADARNGQFPQRRAGESMAAAPESNGPGAVTSTRADEPLAGPRVEGSDGQSIV